MKPVAVFQHTEVGAPGTVPDDPGPSSGLVFMGGDMGVHDPLPWIPSSSSCASPATARSSTGRSPRAVPRSPRARTA